MLTWIYIILYYTSMKNVVCTYFSVLLSIVCIEYCWCTSKLSISQKFRPLFQIRCNNELYNTSCRGLPSANTIEVHGFAFTLSRIHVHCVRCTCEYCTMLCKRLMKSTSSIRLHTIVCILLNHSLRKRIIYVYLLFAR